MKPKVELYSGTYQKYAEELYRDIRNETYGEDIGQTSWLTADEYRGFFSMLKLSPDKKVLEIATGSGGPAVFMVKETGCHLTGIDINENGVHNAKKIAKKNALSEQMEFLLADASKPLPFSDDAFDVVISIDSINHFKERNKVLQEFRRVLKTGGQLLYTDPVVVTGILTNEEIAIRSSIGFFLFVPVGENERLLREAGFKEIQARDVTENIAAVSIKWYNAREKRKDALLKLEEENNFKGVESFLHMVHILSSERRLSRFMFTAVK
jgi:cyclopropane fatty-acyl-phospholipid synthase-like methyltransferase